MKTLLIWSLLAGFVLGSYHSRSKVFKTTQHGSSLQDEQGIDTGHEKAQSWSVLKRQPALQRRGSPRKGITRSASAPNLRGASLLHPSKETNGVSPSSLPRIKTRIKNPVDASRIPSAANLKHDTGLHLSKPRDQESPPKTGTYAEVPVGASPVSSYRTPFSSVQGSPASSPRRPEPNHLTSTTTFQRDQSGLSTTTRSSTNAASSGQMFISQETKLDPKSKTPGKPSEGGLASQIGKPLLWIQNNPAKALRIGASMTANAASGGAAIAAAHHNIPGAACLAIASSVMKIGVDCYDVRDKWQSWHKQKGIDPKENVEATKRVVKAAKAPVSGLWKTISRPLSSEQSVDRPWSIDTLPVRKRSIEYRFAQ